MATREDPLEALSTPQRHVNFVPATAGETFMIGPIKVRIMEDGSHTDNRLGAAEFVVPSQTNGPPPHWHEMHDETFFVTQGTLRFFTTGLKEPQPDIDVKAGDFVTVPTKAPHTFGNPFDKEARFFNTFTPAFYINYFKLLSDLAQQGPVGQPEVMQAMAAYATLPVKGPGGASADAPN